MNKLEKEFLKEGGRVLTAIGEGKPKGEVISMLGKYMNSFNKLSRADKHKDIVYKGVCKEILKTYSNHYVGGDFDSE